MEQNLIETITLYIGILMATAFLILYGKVDKTSAAIFTFILASITALNYIKIFILTEREKKE